MPVRDLDCLLVGVPGSVVVARAPKDSAEAPQRVEVCRVQFDGLARLREEMIRFVKCAADQRDVSQSEPGAGFEDGPARDLKDLGIFDFLKAYREP